MAEGWARHLKGDRIRAYSAGITSHGLNRIAVKVMREAGVDISEQRSKTVKALRNVDFNYVVTVCDNAQEQCPVFPGHAKVIHKSFDDPPRMAEASTSDEDAEEHYRRVRDEIRTFVETLLDALS